MSVRREGGCPYPGSGRGQKGDQLGERLQVLVEARADLLCDALLILVVLPQSHLQAKKPVTHLQKAELQKKKNVVNIW